MINFHLKNKKLQLCLFFKQKQISVLLSLIQKFNHRIFEKPNLNLWINVGYFIFDRDELIKFSYKFEKFKSLLNHLGKYKKLKVFKHNGKHITINSALELDDAKKKIKKF